MIHTLPSSVEEAISNFSLTQKQAYQQAFDADIFNLLVGPLAEAYYVAQRDGEMINPRLVDLNALHYYGGAFDLETVNEYVKCFTSDKAQQEKKLSDLFLAAYKFIDNRSNWRAILTLADYILANSKNILKCEEIIAVIDDQFSEGKKNRQVLDQIFSSADTK